MNSYMLGNTIADLLRKSRNWPAASAISRVLTVITTAGGLFLLNTQRREASRLTDAAKSAESSRAAHETGAGQ
jgi:spermidine/putrescine transport system permease protein